MLDRKTRTGGLWSCTSLQASDLVHLLAQLFKGKAGKNGDREHSLDDLLGEFSAELPDLLDDSI